MEFTIVYWGESHHIYNINAQLLWVGNLPGVIKWNPFFFGGGSNLMQTCGNFKVIFLTIVHEVWAGTLQGGHQRINCM